MVIFKKEEDLKYYLLKIKKKGASIGFVPTMGALHAGHVSLLTRAKQKGDFTVASIFVNPTQFNEKEDFDKYPITIDEDKMMLIEAGCDVLLLPDVKEVYPDGTAGTLTYDFDYLDTVLEGAHRPGHFRGVGQVVARLLHMVQPDTLYLGQKDYQQCMVLKNLVGQLGMDVKIDICPIKRTDDGLAMSSRNRRLTEPQRAVANLLYQCLVSIKTKNGVQSFHRVQKECLDILKDKGFAPEYVALADADDLTLLNDYDSSRPMVALIVAKIGNVRLIDNMLIG